MPLWKSLVESEDLFTEVGPRASSAGRCADSASGRDAGGGLLAMVVPAFSGGQTR